MCSEKGFNCICSYTRYITNLYMDVGKLPNYLKLCGLYLLVLDQFLLYFIIQTVSNGLRFIVAKVLLELKKHKCNSYRIANKTLATMNLSPLEIVWMIK
jgi:hypothetical protein